MVAERRGVHKIGKIVPKTLAAIGTISDLGEKVESEANKLDF